MAAVRAMEMSGRPSRTLWTLILGISALSLTIWAATGVGLKALDVLGLLGVVALLLGISAVYTRLRPDPRLARLARAMAELFLLIFMIGSLSYSGTTLAMPLRDDWFQAMDEALGFDWRYWLSVLDAHPEVHNVLVVAYHSMLPQTVVVAVALAAVQAYDHLDRYLLSYGLAAVATVAIAAAVPALSPLVHLGIQAADHPHIVLAVPLEFQEQANALREGRLKLIDLSGAQGLVTFPSFHTVSAVILILAFAAVPYLRWVALALNVLMLVAIPIEGSHYIVDVLAGAVLALAAWALAGRLLRRERRNTALEGEGPLSVARDLA
jgi:membrane-associated phospholipid phosphatase